MPEPMPCPLCESDGGRLVFSGPLFRVVHVEEPGLPAFYRLIWNAHVAELTDLPLQARAECLEAVITVEEVLRQYLSPHKINLASLGNQVPHLHWHVIARFDWDSHFPDAVWAAARRVVEPSQLLQIRQMLPTLEEALIAKLTAAAVKINAVRE